MDEIKSNIIDILNMLSDVFYRFFYAITNFPFLGYFILGMIGIGGLGFWIDYYQSNDYKMNLFTYSTAIIGTLALDAITGNKNSRLLVTLGTIIGFIAIALLIIGLIEKNLFYLQWGTGLSLLLYFFVESNKSKYKRSPNSSPIGNKNPTEDDLEDE